MFILKGVKVLCFDTLLQVFILRELGARLAEEFYAENAEGTEFTVKPRQRG